MVICKGIIRLVGDGLAEVYDGVPVFAPPPPYQGAVVPGFGKILLELNSLVVIFVRLVILF